DTMEQKLRIAKSFGAYTPGLKAVVSVINLGHHRGAVFVDIHAKRCSLFDHMQLESNISDLKDTVRTAVEKILQLTDQVQYDVITGCVQKDHSSCGLWCLVVVELLLFGADTQTWNDFWSDSLYDVVGYLRMLFVQGYRHTEAFGWSV
ncbi:hypothetical protein PHMEG_00036134, partial [Phytophthora megakarya]